MRRSRFIISLCLAVLFLLLVRWFSGVTLHDVMDLLQRVRPDLLAGAFWVYALSYVFRALRFKVLLRSGAPTFPALFVVVALHNLLNQILPARTGELSYIYLLRTRHQVQTARGVATLAVARVLDLLCLALYLSIGLIHYGKRFDFFSPNLAVACAGLVLAAFAILLALPALARCGLRLCKGIAAGLRIEDKGLMKTVLAKGGELPAAFETIRSRNTLLAAFILSGLTWFCIFATCYLVFMSFEVVSAAELPFGVSIVGTTALNVTCILPINGLGNLGTWEAGWAAGYMLLGIPKDIAFTTGFGLHVAIFAFALVIAAVGMIFQHFLTDSKPNQ